MDNLHDFAPSDEDELIDENENLDDDVGNGTTIEKTMVVFCTNYLAFDPILSIYVWKDPISKNNSVSGAISLPSGIAENSNN